MAYQTSTDNGRRPATTGGSVGVHAAALRAQSGRSVDDLERSLLSLRQARDMVIARNLELSSKLAIAEDRVSELDYEREAADQARDAALKLVQDISQQSDELRHRIVALGEENENLQAAKWEAEKRTAAPEPVAVAVDENLATELENTRRELEELKAMVASLKTQNSRNTATLSEQLAAAQRARDIAVGAVTNAQRQVERLAGERRELQEKLEAATATFEAEIAQLKSRIAGPEATDTPEANGSDPAIEAPVSAAGASTISADASMTLALIHTCIEVLNERPDDRGVLDDLDEHFRGFAASAGGAGQAGIARYASAAGELTRWLFKAPRKVHSTLPALRDAANLLAQLSSDPRPERFEDPAGALVYSVDDDPDNCECIAVSLEKIALRTRYAMKPETALADLATLDCEVIILDVDLPGMDGFELSEKIREMPKHEQTPIIFLSGLMSTKERLASLSGGIRTFTPKPYNLNELGLIVLGMIFRMRLGGATAPAA